MISIGIHDLELSTTHHVLPMDTMAEYTGTDPAKYHLGLGQDEMSVPAPDEDIITMGATAAKAIIERNGMEGIRTLLFATESGVDQSKAAGVSVHQLLGMPSHVRVAEIKQACYGGTAALQAAVALVQRHPNERVLVIASDIAKYGLDSPGEPTQGAGAVAMLVSTDPALVAIEAVSGLCTDEVDDFWRPNDSATAIVDGALSISAYLDSLTSSWDDYVAQGGVAIDEIDAVLYHQPYTKMARKAQARLSEHTGREFGDTALVEGAVYNRRLGNAYTASIYAGLAGALDSDLDLAGKRLGFFSYGSGCVSEFFTGIVQPGYANAARAARLAEALDARVPLDMETYRAIHATELPSAVDVETPRVTAGPFRFAGISGQARKYERN